MPVVKKRENFANKMNKRKEWYIDEPTFQKLNFEKFFYAF